MGTGSPRRLTHHPLLVVAALVASVASLAAPIEVAGAALLPVAVDDATSVSHAKTKTVAAPGVLANDVLVGVELLPGEDFIVELVQAPSHGTLTLQPDGSYTYRPEADRIGTEQFKYRIVGALLGPSNDATVKITVTNATPVAVADVYDVTAGGEFQVGAPGFLANDQDADGDPLLADITDEPAHGTFEQDGDGHFHYTADVAYRGDDTFRYRLHDGFTWSNKVTVVLHVTGPVATAGPTATPKPTSAPTAAPTSTPTAAATAAPTPAAMPAPTVRPRPSPTTRPSPTASPSAAPASPAPSATPIPTGTSDPSPDASDGGTTGGAAPIASPGGPASSGGPGTPATPPFVVAATADEPATIELDTANVTFDGVTWAVPALVLTVPGLLLVLAVASQLLAGVVLVPLARRSMDGDRRRRLSPRR